jgi:hypothetical protein
MEAFWSNPVLTKRSNPRFLSAAAVAVGNRTSGKCFSVKIGEAVMFEAGEEL